MNGLEMLKNEFVILENNFIVLKQMASITTLPQLSKNGSELILFGVKIFSLDMYPNANGRNTFAISVGWLPIAAGIIHFTMKKIGFYEACRRQFIGEVVNGDSKPVGVSIVKRIENYVSNFSIEHNTLAAWFLMGGAIMASPLYIAIVMRLIDAIKK